MPRLRVRTQNKATNYDVSIGRGTLRDAGRVARASLGDSVRKVAIVSNAKVFSLYGDAALKGLERNGFTVTHVMVGDGERYKSPQTAEKLLQFFSISKLERTDGVVALGGGVVGDLAGFAASIFLRGVHFIQIPTTLLAQIDASIGGKTGVNLGDGKNLVGSFHQPSAVLIDVNTLATLPVREVVAGCCEMVKQGAVGSRKLFTQTVGFLQSSGSNSIRISRDLEELVLAHCTFKASIVAQDEREDAGRTDYRSRRILNFGHTVGHALETVTRYRYFRHGEAVGYGVAAAGAISKNLGLLKQSELELLIDAVRLCGPLPRVANLDQSEVIEAIQYDKKRAGDHNQWVLLERIGRARVVSAREINPRLIKESLTEAISALSE
ncbi:MAG TPA: 3-dehydroquinate synthase [Pyrinomonadaceae bacterium]|nr:3-dehydroquinate synthase [Pyrinomonadaceae bacterium]